MLGKTVLDRSINDLQVIIDKKMNYLEHLDVIVGKVFAMLGFIRRLSFEFRDPYTLKGLYTSLFLLKLEYASCVLWSPFYDVRVDKDERVQIRFIRNGLRCLGWMDIYDLPPYDHDHRCALFAPLIACIMFIFDILKVKE
jgi:hypothetical protein